MGANQVSFYSKLLEEPCYKAFRLYYYKKLSQKEIAQRMNVSVYKVRGYLSKSQYQIRKLNPDEDLKNALKILSETGRNITM